MTNLEWNAAVEYLMTASVGSYVEHEGRKVSVEEMAGGRYLLSDSEGVAGLTDEIGQAMLFLKG